MRTRSPSIFSDRDPVSHLDQHAGSVVAAMRQWGIGRVDERDRVHFCGLMHHPEKGAVMFLPRESKSGDQAIDLETASLTMRALARFGAETSKRSFEHDGEEGNPGILSVIKRLSDDFRDRGLFSERVRRQTRNSGKPNWTKTIAREIAMPGHKGQPVFPDIRTSRAASSSDALLAQIQAAVVREIHAAHSWWLSGCSSRRQELLSCARPPFPRSIWASKLDALLPSLYSARSVFLAEHLRFYLRDTRRSSDGTFVFGVSDFHTVWETMLRETLVRSSHDTRRQWNSVLPKPVYYHCDSEKHDARSRGMQTDIILEDATGYTIVDAKYYEASSAKTAPGWTDIAKQMFYEKALTEVLSFEGRLPSRVENVFVFPRNSRNQFLSKVQMEHVDGSSVSSAFSTIQCIYVSMKECLRFYALRSQGIELQT